MKIAGELKANPNKVSRNENQYTQLEGWLAQFQTPWKWRGLA